MREREPRVPRTVVFYPWSLSATGDWSPDTGLFELRDRTPEELVELLWEPGIYVQNSAIVELMAHGNPRKAAALARELVKKHPIAEKSIREGFKRAADYLLKAPLDNLPSKPEEYPRNVKIGYVQ
jgi:hypothetical protein